jgi:hypothetical protein
LDGLEQSLKEIAIAKKRDYN